MGWIYKMYTFDITACLALILLGYYFKTNLTNLGAIIVSLITTFCLIMAWREIFGKATKKKRK